MAFVSDSAQGSCERGVQTTWSAQRFACSSGCRSAAGKHEHAVHHATAGDLDRRGIGDITTVTVSDYTAMPTLSRVGYRLFRNPSVMFGLGWLLVMVLKPRLIPRGSRRRIRSSVLGTKVAIVT